MPSAVLGEALPRELTDATSVSNSLNRKRLRSKDVQLPRQKAKRRTRSQG